MEHPNQYIVLAKEQWDKIRSATPNHGERLLPDGTVIVEVKPGQTWPKGIKVLTHAEAIEHVKPKEPHGLKKEKL